MSRITRRRQPAPTPRTDEIIKELRNTITDVEDAVLKLSISTAAGRRDPSMREQCEAMEARCMQEHRGAIAAIDSIPRLKQAGRGDWPY